MNSALFPKRLFGKASAVLTRLICAGMPPSPMGYNPTHTRAGYGFYFRGFRLVPLFVWNLSSLFCAKARLLFPDVSFRLTPVLNRMAVAATFLLVEFIGALDDLRCQIRR